MKTPPQLSEEEEAQIPISITFITNAYFISHIVDLILLYAHFFPRKHTSSK